MSPCAGSGRANIPTAHALTGLGGAEVAGSGFGVGLGAGQVDLGADCGGAQRHIRLSETHISAARMTW